MEAMEMSIKPETVQIQSQDPIVIIAEGAGQYEGQLMSRYHAGCEELEYDEGVNGTLAHTMRLIEGYKEMMRSWSWS